MASISMRKHDLHTPPIKEIAEVLESGLTSNFAEVNVEVTDCPDLTQPPFKFACKGLGGNAKLVEVGGPPYLLPTPDRTKLYDLCDIAKIVESPSTFIIGAGAGPWPYAHTNCEDSLFLYQFEVQGQICYSQSYSSLKSQNKDILQLAANLELRNGQVNNLSWIGKVNPKDGSNLAEQLPNTETRHALLSNLFFCDGSPGKVIKVHCKKRIGDQDFTTSLRTTIQNMYKDKPVGFGGTFLIKEGTAKHHVMPDFSSTPINNDDELNNWLKFYNFSAPLISVGTFVTADPGLDLRVQHFHSFSHHGEVGHYHIDTKPDSVEYLGYFSLANTIYRLDQPMKTHQFGRD